jgi:uncharacterized protein (TIGR02246 family)
MHQDEQAIRALLDSCMIATEKGDLVTLLTLMSDEIVFTAPGIPPFGKAGFTAGFMAMQAFEVSAKCNPAEIALLGDWAYVRNHVSVTMTPRVAGVKREDRATPSAFSINRRTELGSWHAMQT